MKRFKRGEKGFTLVELLIVVAILGVLAAVVIPNVIGLMGRGGAQAYETDSEVIQLATATFYSDVHGGYNVVASVPYWGCTGQNYDSGNLSSYVSTLQDAGHYYPTALAFVGDHILTLSDTLPVDPDHVNNQRIESAAGVGATDAQIGQHAVWMGLLVEAPGDGVGATWTDNGLTTRGTVSVLLGENGLYLQELPESAMATDSRNGAQEPGGGYCWVVGKNGTVFGAYKVADDEWYAGFSGAYP